MTAPCAKQRAEGANSQIWAEISRIGPKRVNFAALIVHSQRMLQNEEAASTQRCTMHLYTHVYLYKTVRTCSRFATGCVNHTGGHRHAYVFQGKLLVMFNGQ